MKRIGFYLFIITIYAAYLLIQSNFWLEPKVVENLVMEDSLRQSVSLKDSIIKPNNRKSFKSNKKQTKEQKPILIDVNLADSNEFKLLHGIGSYRANRITRFRKALGGFTSVQQVSETYGLPDSVFQNIVHQLVITYNFDKIKINSLPYDSLYPHPYITKQMAYYIMKYRRDKGNIKDYRSMEIILDQHHREMLLKLKPYLDFGIYTN